MIDFIDETSEILGTELNRENMMAIQGFIASETEFTPDGSIVETNSKGEKLTTRFENDAIFEVFEGTKTLTKKITFSPDGAIIEELM